MTRKTNFLKKIALVLALAMTIVGCNQASEDNEGGSGYSSTQFTTLTENRWTNGNLVSPSNGGTGAQWFKITATASTQYIYVKFSTCTDLYVYIYDSNNNMIGNKWNPYAGYGQGAGTIKNRSCLLIPGETYYIKTEKSQTGSYWIGFTDFPAPPETVITELSFNSWTNGNIISQTDGGYGEQWFSFVATTSTQYLYVKFSTCTDLYVHVYDSDYNLMGTKWNPYAGYNEGAGTIKNRSWSLTAGKKYYVKTDGNTGSFWIAFNDTSSALSKLI